MNSKEIEKDYLFFRSSTDQIWFTGIRISSYFKTNQPEQTKYLTCYVYFWPFPFASNLKLYIPLRWFYSYGIHVRKGKQFNIYIF